MRIGWIIRKAVRSITRPIRAKAHGIIGEKQVNAKLNPILFNKVEHRQIDNLILLDDNGMTHQIDHIEIRANGIFCIETKKWLGHIYGSESSKIWTQTLYTGEKHHFSNPLKQNERHCFEVSKLLGNKYKINSLVVMVNNNSSRINCVNVIDLCNLRDYLNEYNDGTELSIEEMDNIYNLLKEARVDITNREHIENIKSKYASVEEGICPFCGGKLVERTGKYGKFVGCSNYPKCKYIKK